jgi:hypothetical protein
LGFLSLLAVAPWVQARPATSEPLFVSAQSDCSDSTLAERVAINLADDVSIAFEDSDEMLRVEIEQRAFGIDGVAIRPKMDSRAARIIRPNISPPLLV